MLNDAEVERRLPVWAAFADLFLDTEMQPSDYQRIALQLSVSGYSKDEMQRILSSEVAPAFVFNLEDVAGEWGAWAIEDVRTIMMSSLGRSASPAKGLFARVRARRLRRYVAGEWARIEALFPEEVSNPLSPIAGKT